MLIIKNNSIIKFNIISVKYLFFIVLIFLAASGYSQNSCAEKLEKAEELYESGQINKVESYLMSCLEKGFSKQEKARAYRLLTLCNLYYNNDKEAEKNFLELLRVDKEYKIKESDPSEFVALRQEYRTAPVFITGIKFGIGILDFYSIKNYNDINSISSNGSYNLDNLFIIGLSFETPVFKDFSATYEFYFNNYAYNFNNVILDYANVSIDESVSNIDIPLLLQWNILKKDFVPYVNIGTSLNYLISSKASYTRTDEDGSQYRTPLKGEEDITDSRNRFNYSLTGGVGFRWKNVIGNGYLTFDIRYSRYFNDFVDYSNRAANPEIVYNALTTDNGFKIQNTQFLIGYKLPFYIPKYKKK